MTDRTRPPAESATSRRRWAPLLLAAGCWASFACFLACSESLRRFGTELLRLVQKVGGTGG
ncbi:MAG: hypothetical protein PVJ57_08670 [Phycisphaerae bacterium]